MSEDRWVRIVDPEHLYRRETDEVWHPVHYPQRWCPVIGLDRQKCDVHSLYKVRCRLRDVPHGTKIVDPGEGYELVDPWESESKGDEEYWDFAQRKWQRRIHPPLQMTPTDIYRRPIARPVSKTPQPGEWWFSNDRPGRAYIHGFSKSGTPIYELDTGSIYTSANWSLWHHEPACTGWDWQPPQPEAEPEPMTLEQRLEEAERQIKELGRLFQQWEPKQ